MNLDAVNKEQTEIRGNQDAVNEMRLEFRGILLDLAKSINPNEKNDSISRLETLYHRKGLRHFYSDVFSVLREVNEAADKGSIDFLGANLKDIWENYQPKNKDENGSLIDISANLQKLYDHVSLDISRIQYSDGGDRKVSGQEEVVAIKAKINALNSDQNRIQGQIAAAQEQIINAQNAAQEQIAAAQEEMANIQKDAQKENVTILGIFAAIVLAFTGGIAFSSSVLQNLHNVGIYKIVFVLLIIGIVLVNFLFGLLYYIDRINTKNNSNKQFAWFPLAVSNVVLILLLFLTAVSWYNGWVEERNRRMHEKYAAVQQADRSFDSESTELVIDSVDAG